MIVEQFKNTRGVPVKNQFIIKTHNKAGNPCTVFQSYNSTIVEREHYTQDGESRVAIYLDPVFWNYSKTTSKYRAQFLGETTKETQKKIDTGIYQLVDLN